MNIILHRSIQKDSFTSVEDGAELPASDAVIVSFSRYVAEKDALLGYLLTF